MIKTRPSQTQKLDTSTDVESRNGNDISQLSFIESVIQKDFALTTECQYSPQYVAISSNQCSWCAFEFAKNSKEFAILHLKKDVDGFIKLYNKCLENGSRLRANCDSLRCGENINDEQILKEYEKDITIVDSCVDVLNPEQEENLGHIENELKTTFFNSQPNNVHNGSIEFMLKRLVSRRGGSFAIVNRFGQSFTILALHSDKFMITDSHCKKTGVTDLNGLNKYITMNNSDGFNAVVWHWGYAK